MKFSLRDEIYLELIDANFEISLTYFYNLFCIECDENGHTDQRTSGFAGKLHYTWRVVLQLEWGCDQLDEYTICVKRQCKIIRKVQDSVRSFKTPSERKELRDARPEKKIRLT